eukprot:scaffold4180_cov99-Cylindrotheca_fusiformis.AAC.5
MDSQQHYNQQQQISISSDNVASCADMAVMNCTTEVKKDGNLRLPTQQEIDSFRSIQQKRSYGTSRVRVNRERIRISQADPTIAPRTGDILSSSARSDYSSSTSNSGSRSKTLCFSPEVSVYEFNTVIGDNPGVSDGCPIALDAKLSNEQTLCLWDLERQSAERTSNQLKLGAIERAQRLHEAGFSSRDIATATMATMKDKEKRLKSNKRQKWDGVNLLVESTGRGLKKIIRSGKNKTPQ